MNKFNNIVLSFCPGKGVQASSNTLVCSTTEPMRCCFLLMFDPRYPGPPIPILRSRDSSHVAVGHMNKFNNIVLSFCPGKGVQASSNTLVCSTIEPMRCCFLLMLDPRYLGPPIPILRSRNSSHVVVGRTHEKIQQYFFKTSIF
jgi:hypothetical protein